jgi:hypothetical protein
MFGSRSCYGISGLTAMKCESGIKSNGVGGNNYDSQYIKRDRL